MNKKVNQSYEYSLIKFVHAFVYAQCDAKRIDYRRT